jgi:hypothetical protein
MSLGWMALIAAFIAVEKLVPWPAVTRRGVAVALLVLGLAIALVPGDVPGFEPPHGGTAGAGHGDSMQMMR